MANFCPTCGKPLQFENAEICPSCGVRIQSPPKPVEKMYAGVWDRFAAYMIDFLIYWIPISIVICCFAILFNQRDFFVFVFVLLLFIGFIAYWLYFAYCESSLSQATLGKRVLKIKVTDGDGQRLSFRKSGARSFCKILFTITPFGLLALINAIIIYYSDNKQGIHDYIVNTRVIKDNP